MKNQKKSLCLALGILMLATSFSACGGTAPVTPATSSVAATEASKAATQDATTAAPEETALPVVPITIHVAGDEPPAQAEVIAIIGKALSMDLQVVYTPWSDYMTKLNLSLTAGEDFDIFLNFYGDMIRMAGKGQLAELNGLLDTYGPDLKASIPQGEFDGLTVDGKLYGVPSLWPRVASGTYFIRKDLREKYGLPEIDTLADFEKYLAAVKENEPDMIPLSVGGHAGTALLRALDPNFGVKWIPGANVINVNAKPYKVESQLRSSLIVNWAKWARKAYLAGWTNKDAATNPDPGALVRSGKASATSWDMWGMQGVQTDLAKINPDAVLEVVNFEKSKPYVSTEGANNMGCINAASKQKERAMMLLNWIRKDQKNYDLYMYGIEGKTYNLVEGRVETLPKGGAPSYVPTPWFTKHLPLDRMLTSDSPEFIKAWDFCKGITYTSSEIQGFSPNTDTLKTEIANVETMLKEKWSLILSGMADYDEQVVKEIEAAGQATITAEMQAQLDAFVASRGIK